MDLAPVTRVFVVLQDDLRGVCLCLPTSARSTMPQGRKDAVFRLLFKLPFLEVNSCQHPAGGQRSAVAELVRKKWIASASAMPRLHRKPSASASAISCSAWAWFRRAIR